MYTCVCKDICIYLLFKNTRQANFSIITIESVNEVNGLGLDIVDDRMNH